MPSLLSHSRCKGTIFFREERICIYRRLLWMQLLKYFGRMKQLLAESKPTSTECYCQMMAFWVEIIAEEFQTQSNAPMCQINSDPPPLTYIFSAQQSLIKIVCFFHAKVGTPFFWSRFWTFSQYENYELKLWLLLFSVCHYHLPEASWGVDCVIASGWVIQWYHLIGHLVVHQVLHQTTFALL